MIAYLKSRTKAVKYLSAFLFAVTLFCLTASGHFFAKGMIRNAFMAIGCGLLVFPGLLLVEYFLRIRFAPIFAFLLSFLFCGGLILGPGFNFYFKIPFWDDMLHTASGLIFACLGYTIADGMIAKNIKYRRFLCFVTAIAFSLAVALLWEMFEYAGSTFLGMDMQEDEIIHKVRSFLLAGTHNDIVVLDNITKTIIYYGDGQTYTIDGFLDIGLYDTLNDMLVCLLGSLALPLLYGIGRLFDKRPDEYLVPSLADAANSEASLADSDVASAKTKKQSKKQSKNSNKKHNR